MSAPPPPPPRRAREPAEPSEASPEPAAAPSDSAAPPPPPRRRAPADDWSTLDAPEAPAAPAATQDAAATTATRSERRATAASTSAANGRANGGASDGKGRRRVLIVGGIVVLVLLVVGGAFAAGVIGGGGGSSGPPAASTNVNLVRGDERVRWPGLGPGQFDRGVADQLMKGIGVYVDNGIVPGLRKGKVTTAGLAAAFDEGAMAQLDGEARGTLLDEGLPKAIGKLTITTPRIEITELNDASNKPVLASAKVDLRIHVQSAKGYYQVRHDGELVFAPDPTGAWKVTGWDVKVERTPPSAKPPWITTTTSAKNGKNAGKGT